MNKLNFKTLVCIGASFVGTSAYCLIPDTQLPTLQCTPAAPSAQVTNNSLIKSVDSEAFKSPKMSLSVDDSETWGEWQALGIADLVYGYDYSANMSGTAELYKRYSTVAGHEKVFQIKIPGIFRDIDAIFNGEENDREPYISMSAESIDYNFNLDGYSDDFVAIGFKNIYYNKATGKLEFKLWYFTVKDMWGLPYVYNCSLRNAPKYSFTLTAKDDVVKKTEQQNIFTFTHSDNIAEVRFYNTPLGYVGPDMVTSTHIPDYDTAEGVIVKGADDNSVSVPAEGYQRYALRYRCYNTDGVAVSDGLQYYWSTRDDGLQWKNIGEGLYADKTLQWFYASGCMGTYSSLIADQWENMEIAEWKVPMQQCVENPNLYRLCNPYANCPWLGDTVDMYIYTTDDDGNLLKIYERSTVPEFDKSQDYYVYLYNTNEFSSNTGSTYFTTFPTGIHIDYGPRSSYYYMPSYASYTQKKYVTFSYDDTQYYKMPGFVDYSFKVDVNLDGGVVAIKDLGEGIDAKYYLASVFTDFKTEEKAVPADGIINLYDQGLTPGMRYNLIIASYDSDGEKQSSYSNQFKLPIDMSGWNYIGKSTIVDPWFTELYYPDSYDSYSTWQVDTYAKDNNSVFGLMNIYRADGSPVYSPNEDALVIIDASDPELIVISPQNVSVYDNTYGQLSVCNYEGFYLQVGYSREDVIKGLAATNDLTTMTADNVINIPMGVCGLGSSFVRGHVGSITLPTTFSSVSDILTETDDTAPVEYYTLSGVRVNNPTLPGLYIRRQGAQASKILVR